MDYEKSCVEVPINWMSQVRITNGDLTNSPRAGTVSVAQIFIAIIDRNPRGAKLEPDQHCDVSPFLCGIQCMARLLRFPFSATAGTETVAFWIFGKLIMPEEHAKAWHRIVAPPFQGFTDGRLFFPSGVPMFWCFSMVVNGLYREHFWEK